MTVINTGLDTAGLKAEFFQRLDATPTHFGELSTRIPSGTKTERYAFLGSVPPMREWGTGRLARGLYAETYDVTNLKYESTLEVDRDEISDDQLGQIRIRVQELAERAATHKDALISTLLANGHSAGFNSYDGVPFFSASHSSGKSGTQSNLLTPSAVDADAPTAAEFRTALGLGIQRLLSLVDDQGEPKSQDASGLVCIVPPNQYMAALEALNATLVSTGGTNPLANAAKVIAFPRLADTSKFFLTKTNVAVRCLIFQDREPPEWTARERDSDTGFEKEIYLYGVRARYRMTYGYWQYCLSLDFTV